MSSEVHPSWKSLFQQEKDYLEEIMGKIGDNFTPNKENIFRFAKTDLVGVKCVWI